MLTKDLGRFHVTSGAITAVDPAYVTVEDSNCAVTFKAKNGIWLATVEEIPENTWTRATDVTVRHVDYPKATPDVITRTRSAWIPRLPVSLTRTSLSTKRCSRTWTNFAAVATIPPSPSTASSAHLSVLRQLGRRRCRRCPNCFHH
jgi:hypothetical protein